MNSKQIKKWEKTRKLGKVRFVFICSILFSLLFSFFFNFVFFLIYRYVDGKDVFLLDFFNFLLVAVLGFVFQVLYSTYVWNKTENRYLQALK
jgi:hypothetical protein